MLGGTSLGGLTRGYRLSLQKKRNKPSRNKKTNKQWVWGDGQMRDQWWVGEIRYIQSNRVSG